MKENSVIFKGTKDGLTIILKEDVEFSEIKEQLSEKMRALKNF